jgi:predicted RNA-binding protein YlqC (UPF0109 family)
LNQSKNKLRVLSFELGVMFLPRLFGEGGLADLAVEAVDDEHTHGGGHGQPNGSKKLKAVVHVPHSKLGAIIGLQGINIRSIQRHTRTSIRVVKESTETGPDVGMGPATDTSELHIYGATEAALEAAKAALTACGRTSIGSSRCLVTLAVPPGAIGRIIGRKGETIKKVVQQTKAQVSVDSTEYPLESLPR